ncbi:MAG TPA: hypothetical protein VFP40_06125 [Terriglobales bacterium]|nr:hypothetical protein [Terriglobales bacterium]
MAFDFAARVLSQPANAALIAYTSRGQSKTRWAAVSSCPPSAVENPYFTLGTHPDCVERLWNKLGERLEDDSRWVVWGRPVLVHPQSGTIFGCGIGTVYALRLDAGDFQGALANGYRTQHVFGNKSVLDVSDFGNTWVIGKWKEPEEAWIQRAFLFAAS